MFVKVCVRVCNEATPLMIVPTVFPYIFTHMLAIAATNDATVTLSLSVFGKLTFFPSLKCTNTHTHKYTQVCGSGDTPSPRHTVKAGVNYRAKQELKRWTSQTGRNWTFYTQTAGTTTHLCYTN